MKDPLFIVGLVLSQVGVVLMHTVSLWLGTTVGVTGLGIMIVHAYGRWKELKTHGPE